MKIFEAQLKFLFWLTTKNTYGHFHLCFELFFPQQSFIDIKLSQSTLEIYLGFFIMFRKLQIITLMQDVIYNL